MALSSCIQFERKNEEVGVLEKLLSSRPLVPSRVFLQILHGPTIHEKMASPLVESLYGSDSEFPITQLAEVMVINSDWHTPFIQYLQDRTLSPDKTPAIRIQCKAKTYALVDDEVHRKSALGIVMNVLTDEGNLLLEYIHCICDNHARAIKTVAKAFRQDSSSQRQYLIQLFFVNQAYIRAAQTDNPHRSHLLCELNSDIAFPVGNQRISVVFLIFCVNENRYSFLCISILNLKI